MQETRVQFLVQEDLLASEQLECVLPITENVPELKAWEL